MNPRSVSAALYRIANLINNSRSPSKSSVIRDLRFICAGMKKDLFKNAPIEYDELGNEIRKNKPFRTVEEKPRFEPKPRDYRSAPGTPDAIKTFDKTTLEALVDNDVIYANYLFQCPWCNKEFYEDPGRITVGRDGSVSGGCDKCNESMKHNPKIYERYTKAFKKYLGGKPFKFAIKDKTTYELNPFRGFEAFREYLEKEDRCKKATGDSPRTAGYYTSQEREILASITGNKPIDLDGILSKLDLFHKPTSATSEPELKSIKAFVEYIEGNGKDFCTVELFTKLFNNLSDGLPGKNKAEKKQFLMDILDKQRIYVGLRPGDSVKAGGTLDKRVKEVLVNLEKLGYPTDDSDDSDQEDDAKTNAKTNAKTIISLINREKLGQFPDKQKIINAYLGEKRNALLENANISKNDFDTLVAWGLIDSDFDPNPNLTILKDALNDPMIKEDKGLMEIRAKAKVFGVNKLPEPEPEEEV